MTNVLTDLRIVVFAAALLVLGDGAWGQAVPGGKPVATKSTDSASQQTSDASGGGRKSLIPDATDPHAEILPKLVHEHVTDSTDYTPEQKQQILDSFDSNYQPRHTQTEVADTIDKLGLDDKPSLYWGEIELIGQFQFREVSGCWVDHTFLNTSVELWSVGHLLVGNLIEHKADSHGAIWHNTGPRCGNSDQGPTTTEPDSIKIRALGYYDHEAKGYYLMLEGDDRTHWTLRSGGDIGVASFLKMYLPYMQSQNTATGSLSGMFISDEQFDSAQALSFKGQHTGTAGTTRGSVVLKLSKSTDGNRPTGLMLDDVNPWLEDTKEYLREPSYELK